MTLNKTYLQTFWDMISEYIESSIGKVLMACEQGRLADFKGKSLDQISISPQDGTEALEESSGLSSEDEEQKDNPTVGEEEGTSKEQLEDEQSSEELSVTEDRGSTPKHLQQNRALRGRASVARGKKDTSTQHQEEEKSSEEELSVTKDRQSTSKRQFGRKRASRGNNTETLTLLLQTTQQYVIFCRM
ncbi:ribosome biogenesis protein BOP1 homolog [Labrus mixtus]|uniref:ribosome biogenesis protein BOP1 homolog n=1 Tax=Labrus mixtus TaxID=508554 RepID=UPI0029C0728F|nr:ribosome biogenesis protein BOP1 homolog [Labrus mixtus]